MRAISLNVVFHAVYLKVAFLAELYCRAVVFKPVLQAPCSAHFVCLPYQTHLIQLISSLIETARPESGVSDKGDIQMCRAGVLVGQV